MRRIRWIISGGLLAAIVICLAFGPGTAIVWERIQANLDTWQSFAGDNPMLALAVFFIAYAAASALPLPVLTVMSLLAGALFGRPTGTIVASLAYTAGVTTAFLLARWLLQERVKRHTGSWRQRIERGIERDGGFYLLTLRLMPSIPFFLINLLMALTPIRTRTYVLVSWVGVLPITLMYASVGTELASIESPADVLSLPLIASLLALATVPLVLRMLMRRRSGYVAA